MIFTQFLESGVVKLKGKLVRYARFKVVYLHAVVISRRYRHHRGDDSAFAAIVRSSSDAVISKTVDGFVTSWNDGATHLYGHTAQEMLGKNIELIVPASQRAAERDRHARVALGVADTGYRCIRTHADGREITVSMSMSPVRDRKGCVVGVASISRLVTALESAETRLALLLNLSPDALVCVSEDGLIVLVNNEASVLFGYPRHELVGMQVEQLLPAKFRVQHIKNRSTFFQHPRTRTLGDNQELQGVRSDGSIFSAEISLSVDVTDGSSIAIATIRDVTLQREMAEQVRNSEAQLRQLAENTDFIITLRQLEPPGYLYVSPNVYERTGIHAEEFIAHPKIVSSLIHPDDLERFSNDNKFASVNGYKHRSVYRMVVADGEIRSVEVVSTPVVGDDGEVNRVLTTSQDITARVQAAEALELAETSARRSNSAKNEFLSRMSHELRTPLNAVLGFGQLLERDLRDADQIEAVQHIVRAGRHLLNLINEVLDIARIEAGELSVSSEAVSVPDIVGEAAALMQPLGIENGVQVSISNFDPRVFVLADRQRLRQILLNLISNAVKYNHRGGGVWLSWTQEKETVTITVRDDGPGIALALQDRLFEPFDRLGVEASGVEGTGIGLTVTRNLAQLMRGDVLVSSDVGCGATFSVVLPIAEEPRLKMSESALHRATVPNSGPPGSKTVLYIEDSVPNFKVLETLMRSRPTWRLLHAGLAGLGLDLARTHLPDLILLDIHLPDGSGFDVLTALKGDPRTASIMIVVLSADASRPQIRRCTAAGAAMYMTKPFDIDEMLHLLDTVSERPTTT